MAFGSRQRRGRADGLSMLMLAVGLLAATAVPVLGLAIPSGAVVTLPQLTVTPNTVAFGATTVGDLSNPTTVKLTNTGGTADMLTGDRYSGTNPNDFVAFPYLNPDDNNNCTIDDTTGDVTIPPNGGSCDLIVGFFPGAVGNRSATITLTDSSTLPVAFTVSGTGTEGYYEATANGAVHAFGDAQLFGDISQTAIKAPIVSITQTGDNGGYWLTGADGGIFAFGDAPYLGSTGSLVLNKPIVSMSQTGDGEGYWLVASDGGIFSYGDAQFFGSTGALKLNKPIVGMAPNPVDGGGYWLVASDGGIFAFGDTAFYGSTGNIVLNKPIVGMAATPDGGGYWLVASDGGIFAFGDAQFYGSTGALTLNQPIVGMAVTPDGGGYWLVASDGGIFAFGDAPFYGSIGGTGVTNDIGMAISSFYTAQAILDQPAYRAHQIAELKAALKRGEKF